ncbi:aminopeptidase O, partial [Aplysia californica]|uniref:Aminopeptidase O n=1 Tax=Aplysia californica TaxID=6500 RepID=A0ABM0JBY7_APLCA
MAQPQDCVLPITGGQNDSENDLPLSSNFKHVKVRHFVMELKCSFQEKRFDGSIVLFCQFSPNHSEAKVADESIIDSKDSDSCFSHANTPDKECEINLNQQPFNECLLSRKHHEVCLDCHSLDVSACFKYTLSENESVNLSAILSKYASANLQIPAIDLQSLKKIHNDFKRDTSGSRAKMAVDFSMDTHCLKVALPKSSHCDHHVAVIEIQFKTQAAGPSLMWTFDQCQRECVFTIGHQLNNRSLFPAQDMPEAMVTWHSSVTLGDATSEEYTVLMTAESNPYIYQDVNGAKVFEHFSSFLMPASTFALAVGCWQCLELCRSEPSANLLDPSSHIVPCRLFGPESLMESARSQLSWYMPRCFERVQHSLGRYPLPRLDILIVPACFNSLGMACPCLMFLSQSVLCRDISMFARVSHELCHTWLGIMTGPSDWTEEWLTEGVCCYLEDILHASVMEWTEEETQERLELRTCLKLRLLEAEVEHTPPDLQTLRPNKGEPVSADKGKEEVTCCVKNGMNSEKTLMQVHYLKGFFLLKHLEQVAGRSKFLKVLKDFITDHLGMLFSSQEFLEYLLQNCQELRCSGLTVAQLCRDWLDAPGIPQSLVKYKDRPQGKLAQHVHDLVSD